VDFPLARQRFYQEIHQPDDQIDLARAALYLAQEDYPDLNPEDYITLLDSMAMTVHDRLPAESYPLRIIQAINQYLYEELGFHGNTEDYYDPRNSFLNQVLDRRTGIPISLALVYLEIARRVNFPMVGVGMPGHFLIRPVVEEMDVFVDPFHRGEILFPQDCQERLSQIYGKPMALRPEFVEPVTPHYFLARMLTNLKAIYLSQEDLAKALSTIERILMVFPHSLPDQRDRGLLYYEFGRWREASRDLESYLAQMPAAKDAFVIRHLLKRIEDKSQS
jgi:regulator of sirC expression with transglutaminase-like and TPR domain